MNTVGIRCAALLLFTALTTLACDGDRPGTCDAPSCVPNEGNDGGGDGGGSVDAGGTDGGGGGDTDGGADAGDDAGADAGLDGGFDGGFDAGPYTGPSFVQVATGDTSSCGVTEAGTVLCWGTRQFVGGSQIGDGQERDAPAPVQVSGIDSGATAVAVGGSHACAIVSGGVKCWGNNGTGQLGNNSTTSSNVPVDVSDLSDIVQVSAGLLHTCALRSDGAVLCWGRNQEKQLGVDTPSSSRTPLAHPVLTSGVTEISSTRLRTCAVRSGEVYCWGDSSTGAAVPELGGVTRVAAGEFHTCVSTATEVKCWGDNFRGRCGNGTTSGTVSTPAAVQGLSGPAMSLSAGRYHTCAVTSEGLFCWGAGERLGTDSVTDSGAAVRVPSTVTVDQVSTRLASTCIRRVDTSIQCWGAVNEIGNGESTELPQRVPNVRALDGTAFANDTCVIDASRGVTCWGDPFTLSPPEAQVWLPRTLAGLLNITQLASSLDGNCALSGSGELKCWGLMPYANGTNYSDIPAAIAGISTPTSGIWGGPDGFCAALSNGELRCWSGFSAPAPGPALAAAVKTVSVGQSHACALLTTGGVQCWGAGSNGQLGNGGSSSSATPVTPTGLSSGVEELGGGAFFTCARLTTGEVRCWGANAGMMLGTNGFANELALSPVTPVGLGPGSTSALFVRPEFACARLTVDGSLSCWGESKTTLLSFGSTSLLRQPTPIPELGTGAQGLMADALVRCVIGAEQEVTCWGSRVRGKTGAPGWWGAPQPLKF